MASILQLNSAELQIVNAVIDSLDLRVLRFAFPSPWLVAQIPTWRDYHQNSEPGSDPLIIELPGLGSFRLKATKSRPYEFVLINPEVADIRIWNPDKWPTAIAGATGQFYVSFRSKFLQYQSTKGVSAFLQAMEALFCVSWPESGPGWERVSRADLAADLQMTRGYEWTDLDRFVSRARWKDINTDSISLSEQIKEVLSSPPMSNKGGATYNVSGELLLKAAQALDSGGFEDGYLYRVVAKREVQTVYFGRFGSPLYARLYDKRASLKNQGKEYMEDIWRAAGWDGESPVWRHEFSLSGDFLRALANVQTGEIEDVRAFELFLLTIPRIWRYLTTDWLRFTEDIPGDTNPWRSPVADSWAVLQMAFASPLSIVRARPPRQPQEEQLRAQMLGVALTLAAKRARSNTDPRAYESIARDFFEWVDSPGFYDALADRRRLLGVDDFTDTSLSALYRAERMAEGLGS
jgi:hypothetical protein